MTFRLPFFTAVLAYLTYAQNSTATMVGVVRDQSSAVITGVDLEIRNTDTAVSRRTVTNQTAALFHY